VRVIPTLAGRLTAPASSLALGFDRFDSPPAVWNIR